jgi:hypothetical protein
MRCKLLANASSNLASNGDLEDPDHLRVCTEGNERATPL